MLKSHIPTKNVSMSSCVCKRKKEQSFDLD